jgi:amino acid adenylation domain-containing protein
VRAATIDGLLRLAAHSDGQRTAAVDGERTISYAELDAVSSQLAHALCSLGVAPGERVGLFLEKSLEAVIGIYGTLKAGATYVPLDDQAPVKRLAYIARDAGIRCLVTSSAKAPDWPRLLAEGAPLEALVVAGEGTVEHAGITALAWSDLAGLPSSAPDLREDADALAYILYTSGSTGEPKGVMLSHRNGLAFVDWAAREIGVGAQDRLSSHAPLHFDLSTFDLFAAAWGTAPVVLVPGATSVFPIEVARFIREQQITVWYSVPSILTQLVLRGDLDRAPLPTLRAVIFAGEVFPVKYLRQLLELVPQARHYNFYGPTETNVCTWYEVPRGEPLGQSLPIGRPIPGVEAIVQGDEGQPVAPGEVGELLIRGPTVMHGYWGDPDRTRRTLSHQDGERVYRTGDLVREGHNGNLLFLGRRDAQIKTRGYRVELGEVEAALNALSFVVESAVIAIPDEAITTRLKAFVVTSEPVSAAELAAACADRLPRYMIPEEFELTAGLPKSTTGKIDRQQLQRSAR